MKPSPKKKILKSSLLVVLLSVLLHGGSAFAVEPFVLKDIRIEGLQRTEAGTVFGSLPFRVGDIYTDDKGAAAIRALFATGLFKDVRIEIEREVAVVVVEERPVLANVEFVGVKEFDKEALVKALRDIGLTEGRPFDKALADRAEQELKRQYLTRSLYGAEVLTTVTPLERNRVNVTFTVTEGTTAKIKEIRIIGHRDFPASQLLSQLDLTVGGWFTWYSKSDRYSRTKLNADLETLRSFYLNRGYLEFSIDSTQVAISPDKRDITITINITEGQRFVVTGVTLQGDYLGKDEDFKTLVKIRPGQPYKAEDVAETVKAFQERFGAFGYAFARIDARPEIDRVNGQVKLVMTAEPVRRIYVRRINVVGNTRTRDEVIRREFRQFESAWYNAEKIRLSRDRVDRLGFFKEVTIETTEVPGTQDQVDLTINVVEKPTGNLLIGAGFSSAERLSLTASIKQDNVFGTGNYLGIELNTSQSSRTLVVSSIDPYFTIDGISRSLDFYYRTRTPLAGQGGDYRLITPGASIRFGVPFSEFDTVYFGAGLEQTEIRPGTNIPATYLDYSERFGAKSNAFPLTVGWTRDDRDSALVPNQGRYQRLYGEWGVAGDARYIRANYQYQHYVPLTKQITVAFNGEIGWGQGLAGKPFPVFKHFYAGGLGTVRGYEQGSLGPRDVTGSFIGGPQKLNFNLEAFLPFPGAGNDRTLRWFGFADAGNVFAEDARLDAGELRSSAGVGLSWISPVGPLKLSYGVPLNPRAGDRIQRFQFQIGTAF